MSVKKKKIDIEKLLRISLFLIFLVSIFYLLYLMIISPESMDDPRIISGEFIHVKSDYFLAFAQSILGIIVMFIPDFFERRFNVDIPSYLVVMYLIFLYGAIFLGETRFFYYKVPYWDTVLHCFSAAMLGLLGFSLVFLLNGNEKVPMQLSPIFICIFAFAFAVGIGVLWEIYEYVFDGLWGMNMQKFMLEDGTVLVGHAALKDTMDDLIVDCIGAGSVCLLNYIILKFDVNFINTFKFKKFLTTDAKKDNNDKSHPSK